MSAILLSVCILLKCDRHMHTQYDYCAYMDENESFFAAQYHTTLIHYLDQDLQTESITEGMVVSQTTHLAHCFSDTQHSLTPCLLS